MRAASRRPSGGLPSPSSAAWKRGSGEPAAPLAPGPLAQPQDLQLAPGVAAVARVEGAAPGLGRGRRAGQVGVAHEQPGGLLQVHRPGVQADRAGQPGDPDQRFERDADREPRVAGPEPLFEADLLDVVRPALGEGHAVQYAADRAGRPAQRAAVGEVAGGDLVHGDRRQAGPAEDAEPLLALLGRPVRLRRGDVVPRRALGLAGRGPGHHRHRPAPGGRRRADQALAVEVRRQAAVAGEGDHLLGEPGRLGDHAVRVGVVGEQAGDQLVDRAVRVQRAAGVGEQFGEPGAFAVGVVGERRQVHPHALLGAHQRGQRRRRRAAGRGRRARRPAADVRDQPGVRPQAAASSRPRVRVEVGGQAAGGAEQRARPPAPSPGRARRARRPPRPATGPGARGGPPRGPCGGRTPGRSRRVRGWTGADTGRGGAVRGRRTAPASTPRRPPGAPRRGGPPAGPCRRARSTAASDAAHPVGGQVLDPSVVFVQAGHLPGLGHHQVAHRAQTLVHHPTVPRGTRG